MYTRFLRLDSIPALKGVSFLTIYPLETVEEENLQ